MKKIVIDAGHGLNTPGKRTPDDEREWSFNNKVALAAIAKLNRYEGVQILRVDDPTGKTDVPLKTRTNRANNWKVDVYISIHHNALGGVWGKHSGVETFTFDHPQANPKSFEIAKLIHLKVVKVLDLQNRGIKKADFHILRETLMPAILIEGGFMDSTTDIVKLRNDKYLIAHGEAIAEGLVVYYKLKLKSIKVKPELEKDRPVSESHKEAWNWATEKGLLNGERPGDYLTREQFATVLKRYDDLNKEISD